MNQCCRYPYDVTSCLVPQKKYFMFWEVSTLHRSSFYNKLLPPIIDFSNIHKKIECKLKVVLLK